MRLCSLVFGGFFPTFSTLVFSAQRHSSFFADVESSFGVVRFEQPAMMIAARNVVAFSRQNKRGVGLSISVPSLKQGDIEVPPDRRRGRCDSRESSVKGVLAPDFVVFHCEI